MSPLARIAVGTTALLLLSVITCQAQDTSSTVAAVQRTLVTCTSKAGDRTQCAADTSAGVLLVRSFGTAACLLGKTWGYDQTSIWVSEGCSAEFSTAATAAAAAQAAPAKTPAPRHIDNVGFLLFDGDEGQIYMRLFTYARYLNQRNLDESYVDAFGKSHTVARRQDIQLQKFFLPFSGWFLTPKMRYYLYVWSSNASQGDPAQVVGAGNISWSFNRFVSVGAGITSLPAVRSTEGQFPYWLGVDDRLIADEFFRGSYTSGVWLKGELHTKVKYMVMFANNLSTLGVSAAQLDNKLDTQSYSVQWLPSTGEFGPWGGFGDFEGHEKLATRVGLHYTHSLEEKQSQPGTEGIENSQIRLTDGSVIFTPDLFGPGITVNSLDYHMTSVDGGLKYKGAAVEGEYYWRWLRNLQRRQHGQHPQHRRYRLPAADLGDGGAQGSPAVFRRVADLRQSLRRRLGSARRRELVPDEEARHPRERRVDVRRPLARRLHGVSVSSRRPRHRLPHQSRVELLIAEIT